MKQAWHYPMASNFDLSCGTDDWGAWNWLKRPIVDVAIEVEKWDVLVKLLTVVQKGNLIEIRAYFPMDNRLLKDNLQGHPRALDDGKIPKFESATWCMGCRKKTDHDSDECRVAIVMES